MNAFFVVPIFLVLATFAYSVTSPIFGREMKTKLLYQFEDENEKFGFLDTSGQTVIPFVYQQAHEFSDGLALVTIPDPKNRYGIQAFIDTSGVVKIGPGPPKKFVGYELWQELHGYGQNPEWRYGDFHEGFASFYHSGFPVADEEQKKRPRESFGYIDKTGEIAIPLRFRRAHDFFEGLAYVVEHPEDGGRAGFIDSRGEMVIVLPGEIFGSRFSEGLAVFEDTVDGEDRYGYVDKQGKVVVPAVLRICSDFHCSRALALSDTDKYGYIDGKGIWIIPPRFRAAGDFSEGVSFVTEDGRGKIIDPEGNELATADFDCSDIEVVHCAEGKFIIATKGLQQGKWGCVDRQARLIVPLEFSYVSVFRNDLARAEKNGTLGLIDTRGRFVRQRAVKRK